MARGDLLCPVCSAILGLPSVQFDNNADARSRDVGGHVHVFVSGTWTCANNHRFRVEGEFRLHREV